MDDSSEMLRFNSPAIKRWTCFIAAIWLQSINGTNFDFSVYSSDLKNIMGINQIQLNSLAVASDLGKVMGWVSGLACAVLPTWAVLAIGISLGVVGYGVQWLILSEIIHPLAYWQVYILCFLAGNSICWFNTVSFKAAIENFPSERGMASGLSTSYVGLSPIIYTCLSSIIDPGNPSLYLLLNSTVPVVVGVILAVILHVSQLKMAAIEDKTDKKYMIRCTLIALATAVFSIAYVFLPHGKRQLEGVYLAVLIILLMAPTYIPFKVSFNSLKSETKVNAYISSPEKHNSTVENPTNNESCEAGSIEIEENKINNQNLDIENPAQTVHNLNHIKRSRRFRVISVPHLGEEHGILQLLRSIDFWLYYFVYFCGGTVGLVYMNNLGQVVQSLGYSKTPILVSLVSSFGFFGRIASGLPDYIQEWQMLRKYRPLPRPGWMGIWMIFMVLAFFMLRFMNPTYGGVLYVCIAIIGTSVGAISAIGIPISSEMFGMKSFGVNHNILVTNIAFGSLLFGEVAGIIYDDSSDRQWHLCMGRQCFEKTFLLCMGRQCFEKTFLLCMGRQCFEKTFLLWGFVCLFGVVLCIVLCMRTRELYESIHKQQCHERDKN